MSTDCNKLIQDKLKVVSDLSLKNSKGSITVILDLIYRTGGDFLLLAADYITQIVGTSISSYMAVLISTVGSSAKTAIAGTAAALLIVNELANKTVMQYLSAKALKESLEYRQKLVEAMTKDVDFLISILNALVGLPDQLESELFKGIPEAKREVESAILIISIEMSADSPIDNFKLEQAISHLENAIVYLNRGVKVSPTLLRTMDALHRKHGIAIAGMRVPMVNVLSPDAIESYLKDTAKIFLTDNLASNWNDLDQELQNKWRVFLLEFIRIPGIREIFVIYASTLFIGDSIERLTNSIPILSLYLANRSLSAALELSENTLFRKGVKSQKIYSNGADVIQNLNRSVSWVKKSATFLNLFSPVPEPEYPKPEITFLGISTTIFAIESRIKKFNQLWKDIKEFGLQSFNMLQSAKTGLSAVVKDMDGFLKQSLEEQKRLLIQSKLNWTTNININKAFIFSSMDTELLLPGGRKVSLGELRQQMALSNLAFAELQKLIKNKHANPTQDYTVAYEQANKNLTGYFAAPFIYVKDNSRKEVIASLQSLAISFDKIRSDDMQEIFRCNQVISPLENNILFQEYLEVHYTAAIQALKDSPAYKNIAEALSYGDPTILAEVANKVKGLKLRCPKLEQQSETVDETSEEFLEIQADIENELAITQLQKTFARLNVNETNLQNIL